MKRNWEVYWWDCWKTCRCNKGFNDRFDGIVSAGGNKISEI